MTTREELRVVEALQAFTGRLAVTEQDLLSASDRFKKNLEPRQPRRRIALVAIVAAAAVVAGTVIFQAIDDEKSAPDITTETATPNDQWDL